VFGSVRERTRTLSLRSVRCSLPGFAWVTRESDALDLRGGVFKLKDPKRIAKSLKRSAEKSRRRKTGPYRSALSMLIFLINRAGKNLPVSRRRTVNPAAAGSHTGP
jgi:Protein of unknown function (DUF3175)